MKKTPVICLILSINLVAYATAQNISLKSEKIIPYGVIVKSEQYKGKEALVLEQPTVVDDQKSMAYFKEIDFHNGIIEISIAGNIGNKTVEGARGFVGIAFRVLKDTSKFPPIHFLQRIPFYLKVYYYYW